MTIPLQLLPNDVSKWVKSHPHDYLMRPRAFLSDGRMIPQVGDRIFTIAKGFGGAPAYVEAEAIWVPKHGLKGKITKATGGVAPIGQAVNLHSGWSVVGDPRIAEMEREKETAREARTNELNREEQEEAARVEAFRTQWGPIAARDLYPGDTLEDIDGEQDELKSVPIEEPGWIVLKRFGSQPVDHWRLIQEGPNRPKPEPLSTLGGYLSEIPIRNGGTLRVNDSFYFSKDDKRFVVVALRGPIARSDGKLVPILIASALAGSDKGSLFRNDASEGMYGGIVTKLRFPSPIFYGRQAQERYNDYLKWLRTFGDPSNAVPFQSAPEKPVEPDAPHPPSDTETAEEADVGITHTTQSGTRIDWKGGKENPHFSQLREIARQGGFVWAPQAREWRRTNSIGLVETRAPIAWMVDRLHALGLRVFLGLEEGETEAAIARRKQYLTARSGYMAEASVRWRGKAQSYLEEAQRRAEEAVRKAEIPGYFPTPPDVAQDAVAQARIQHGNVVLDPSAGHGALANAMRKAGATEVDTIELHPALRGLLAQQGFPVVAEDTFDPSFQPGTLYDRIVMNPPYENAAWIDHVYKAWEWLKPGGRLVAIVPEGVVSRSDRKHEAFRAWLEQHQGQLRNIERQAFGRANSIKTQVIILDKSTVDPFIQGDPVLLAGIEEARAYAAQDIEDMAESRLDISGLSGRQAERAKAKAERAMQKAKEAGEYADLLQRRSASRLVAADRTEAIDVSKGGRTAGYKPRYYGPSQTNDEFLAAMRERIGRIKKPTGAIKVERGFFSAHDIAFTLWFDTGVVVFNNWSERNERKTYKLVLVVFVGGGEANSGRYLKAPEGGAGFLIQRPLEYYSASPRDIVGEGVMDEKDPDALFGMIVDELSKVTAAENEKYRTGARA